jgi:hypothetical protein
VVLDIEPLILPPWKVGGESVCEIFVAGLLSQLDTGAPRNGKDLGCGLWFNPVVTVCVLVMLDLYFDSVKCMLVSVKLLCMFM